MFYQWIDKFQANVNDIFKSDKLQFTLDVWNFDGESPPSDLPPNISINSSNNFPFLDMKMHGKQLKSEGDIKWNDGGLKVLSFSVHHKANQRLKYLNDGSTHKPTVFHATPKGVCHRLASLTSFDDSNSNKTLDQTHPIHTKALSTAGLVKENQFPILSKCILPSKTTKHDNSSTTSDNTSLDDPSIDNLFDPKPNFRNTHMTIGFCELWKLNFIPQLVKRLKAKHVNLNWIRIRMSCRRFSNVEEILGGMVTELTMKSIVSRDMVDRPCDCSKPNLNDDGLHIFKGRCRESCVTCKVDCTMCKKTYVGNTQNHLKKRIQ